MAAGPAIYDLPADAELQNSAPQQTRLRAFVRRFARNRLALVGLLIIALEIVCALAAPLISPYDPLDQKLDQLTQPEGAAHLMGTDELGRDELSRVIYGTRLSLQAAIYAVGLAALVS